MRRITKGERVSGDHLGRERAQASNGRPRLVQQPRMGLTGREKSIGCRDNGCVLDRDTKSRHRFRKAPIEE